MHRSIDGRCAHGTASLRSRQSSRCGAHAKPACRRLHTVTRAADQKQSSGFSSVPLFSDSSLFGEPSADPMATSSSAKSKFNIDEVELTSEAGLDYTALRDHLKAGDFRKADDETRQKLIELAGDNAVKRGWVYFTEIKSIPITDLQTLDALWKAGSNGKFGYSVQRDIYRSTQKKWAKFFKKIDWVVGENNVYRKWPMEFFYSMDAPKGHLPLTNCLRGTQLFQELLDHPAFNSSQ